MYALLQTVALLTISQDEWQRYGNGFVQSPARTTQTHVVLGLSEQPCALAVRVCLDGLSSFEEKWRPHASIGPIFVTAKHGVL
mmetsp:Transcript_123828/g.361558  ORF Transcript_123828/g.361558 Transcript_123828/m.361558 type:complete len:83 (+) Transcript_123828:1708-1956(+)